MVTCDHTDSDGTLTTWGHCDKCGEHVNGYDRGSTPCHHRDSDSSVPYFSANYRGMGIRSCPLCGFDFGYPEHENEPRPRSLWRRFRERILL